MSKACMHLVKACQEMTFISESHCYFHLTNERLAESKACVVELHQLQFASVINQVFCRIKAHDSKKFVKIRILSSSPSFRCIIDKQNQTNIQLFFFLQWKKSYSLQ